MKIIAIKILTPFLFATIVTACKKETKETTREVTIENLAGTYTLVSVQSKSLNIPLHDKTDEFVDVCEKDDKYVLNPDMSFAYQEAGVACAQPRNRRTHWKLAGTHIKFDQFEGEITHLTNKQLVIVLTFSLGGITYSETYTFRK